VLLRRAVGDCVLRGVARALAGFAVGHVLLSFMASNRLNRRLFLGLRRAARGIGGFSPSESLAPFPLPAAKA
jgi:hypothetical protein